MADILLNLFDGNNGNTPVYTFRIRNRESFHIGLDMPATLTDIPETDKSYSQAIKLEGNTMKITVVWLLNQESVSVVDQLTGGNAILTPQQQVDFLLNNLESTSMQYRYNISIAGASPPFSYDGLITKFDIEQSAETADKWKCTMEFVIGAVMQAISTGASLPAPTNLVATAASSSQINLSWTAPPIGTTYTGFKIERAQNSGGPWILIKADTGNTNTTYSDTGLSSGTRYYYRVSTRDDGAVGDPSAVASATTS